MQISPINCIESDFFVSCVSYTIDNKQWTFFAHEM